MGTQCTFVPMFYLRNYPADFGEIWYQCYTNICQENLICFRIDHALLLLHDVHKEIYRTSQKRLIAQMHVYINTYVTLPKLYPLYEPVFRYDYHLTKYKRDTMSGVKQCKNLCSNAFISENIRSCYCYCCSQNYIMEAGLLQRGDKLITG